MAAQNLIGVAMAKLMGLKAAVGLLCSVNTVSLVGGHGVTIAWSPSFVNEFEIANAMEIGLAASTIGLILASLSGGPVASYLIKKHSLQSAPSRRGRLSAFFSRAPLMALFSADEPDQPSISYQSLLSAAFSINVCVIVGQLMNSVVGLCWAEVSSISSLHDCGIVASNLITSSRSRALA